MLKHATSNVRRLFALFGFDIAIVLILVATVVTVRIPIVAERKVMPAGDAFNYQFITSHLLQLQYPLQEKRLPTYPIFLIGGRILNIDPIQWSIGVAVAGSAGAMATLYALGRALQLPRPPLLGMLGLAAFDPFLIMNAVRPFADSWFVCLSLLALLCTTLLLQQRQLSHRRLLWITGVVYVLLMFTRYEGVMIAGILLASLLLHRRWREVLIVGILPLITGLAWIPAYLYIHGSLTGGYLAAAEEDSGYGEVSRIPQDTIRMFDTVGWGKTWTLPAYELNETPRDQAAQRIGHSRAWWISVASILGVGWIFIRWGRIGIPFIVTAISYAMMIAWWFSYSRYNPLLLVLFYLTAAAGMTALVEGSRRLLPKKAGVLATLALYVGMMWLMYDAPALYKTALSRAWEGNRKGYALYEAIQFVGHQEGVVALLARDYPMAVFTFGRPNLPRSRANPVTALYLSDFADESAEQLARRALEHKVSYIIETDDDPRLADIVSLLHREGRITETNRFQHMRWDDFETERAAVHRLK